MLYLEPAGDHPAVDCMQRLARLPPLLLGCLAVAAPAQTPAPTDAGSRFPILAYPRDKDRVLARVADRPLRLEDLAQHIDQRHYPGFREFLATDAGNLLFRSDLVAPWVRQFADIQALRAEVGARGRDPDAADPALRASLKEAFAAWLAQYSESLARNGISTELSQHRLDRLLADFQMKHGLAAEVQGWLDFLEPDDFTDTQLRDYFSDNPRVFGGTVTIAHILIQHRDAGTGILLEEEGRQRALRRLAEVKARLRPDGANFGEVAALMSEDTVTAAAGGELANIARFDDRMPAILCRTAWFMQNGEISEPLESQYGYHIIRRIAFDQRKYALFTEGAKPEIRMIMRRHRQEDLLFRLRREQRVTLQY